MASRTHEDPAADAAAYIAGSGDIVPSCRGDALEQLRQSELLSRWAQETHHVINYCPPPDAPTTKGTEHEVFFHQQADLVYKRTHPGTFGSILTEVGLRRTATPYFYLRRIELTNEFFDSDLRLEGVTLGDKISIVISQPWAHPADPSRPVPSDAEVGDFMSRLGFERVANTKFEWVSKSNRLRVSDARPDNFIKSKDGVVPIDLVVGRDPGFETG